MDQLQSQIETRIAELDPAFELVALQRVGRDTLRIFIDRPEGIGLEHCESVTRQLRDLLADYALEVSSPGLDRPLTKPEHYARFGGEMVRVRLREPIDGQRNFTGRIGDAGPDSFVLETDDGAIDVPLERVHRSNLVPEPSEVLS